MHYREEIFHPALNDPVVARGRFEIGRDGSLIRHQTEPEVETVRIGEDFIFLRRASEGGGSNIIPIPTELSFLFASLRAIVGHTSSDVLQSYDHQLETDLSGWNLTLSPGGGEHSGDRLVVEGCGDQMQVVELRFQGGDRRRISFEPAP